MTTTKDFLQRNSVLIYFALVFTISWGIILVAVGFDGLGNPEDLNIPPVYMAMLAGPSLAGMLLTGFVHKRAGFRELLSRLVRWRVSAHWYIMALLAAPLLAITVLLTLSLFSAEFTPNIIVTKSKLTALLAGILAGLSASSRNWAGPDLPSLK